jgi:hypothetical protein
VTTSAVGAATWIFLSTISHRREAFDDPAFFTIVLPAIALTAAAVSFVVPEKPWRWAMLPFAAQALVAIVQNPTANLMPLGLIAFAIFGGLCAIPAAVGAAIGRRVSR